MWYVGSCMVSFIICLFAAESGFFGFGEAWLF